MCNAIPNMTDMPVSRRVNVLGLLFCTRGPEFHLIGHFEYSSKSNTEFQESFMSLCMIFYLSFCISQFHLPPAPPPRATAARHFPALSVPGVGHLQILPCPGAGHLQSHIKMLKMALFDSAINEKCYGVDGGRGICPLVLSPPRGI